MISNTQIRAFWANESGAAAEFALVLPVLMLLFFGLIDAGRYAWTFNQGEKATQIGARFAVVTDPLAPQLTTQSYVGQSFGGVLLSQGDRIPISALGKITCGATACTCATTPCPSGIGTADSDASTLLINRMKEIFPEVGDDGVTVSVDYSGSGLGYAGNPNGMDVVPFVTVRVSGVKFTSIMLFGTQVSMPDFAYTLTMEDGSGTGSN